MLWTDVRPGDVLYSSMYEYGVLILAISHVGFRMHLTYLTCWDAVGPPINPIWGVSEQPVLHVPYVCFREGIEVQ